MAAGPEGCDTDGIDRPSRSSMIVPVALSEQERLDLVVFMQTLTGVAEGEPAPKLPGLPSPRGTARRAVGAPKMSFEENLPALPLRQAGQTGHGAGRLCRGLMERGSAPRNAPEPSAVSAVAHLRKVNSNGSDQTKGSLRLMPGEPPDLLPSPQPGPGLSRACRREQPGLSRLDRPRLSKSSRRRARLLQMRRHPAQAIGSVLL